MNQDAQIEALKKVALLAGSVVLETPVKSSNSFQSYVRRSLIAEIEAALVAAGYDMKAARKRMKKGEKHGQSEGINTPTGAAGQP